MITRRSFLSALAALPVMGKLVPVNDDWAVSIDVGPSYVSEKAADFDWASAKGVVTSSGGDQIVITSGNEAFLYDADAETMRKLSDYLAKAQSDAFNDVFR